MTLNWQSSLWKLCIAVPIFTGWLVASMGTSAVAQITPDGTLGNEASQVKPINNNVDRIDGGAVRGSNLFHSFQDFNVGEGRGAYFANPAGIENILSRVTGGNPSNIFGTLGVLGNANLFLLNPNGIIFGPNARLDIRGSFVGSAAGGVNFSDRTFFGGKSQTTPLLTMAVPIGLQYGMQQAGNISNSGNLAVGQGQKLSLVGGTVTSNGQLTAPGGTIHLLGNLVGLLDNARVDVSSETAGGTVLIGGDFHGKGEVPNAARTFVSPNATINADALVSGDGGRVIVWADEVTGFYGNISARGGRNSGNGGFAEVSGKQNLIFDGKVNLSATNGNFGTLLLDPIDITISNAVSDTPGVTGASPEILTTDFVNTPISISQATLERLGQNATVKLQATNNIKIEDLTDNKLTFANSPGNLITFEADADKNGVGSFSMKPGDTISTNGRDIEISGASISLGNIYTLLNEGNSGSVVLSATGDISTKQINTRANSELNAGDIKLASKFGKIDVTDILRAGSSKGKSGNVDLSAFGNISIRDIYMVANGSINIVSINGGITTGLLDTSTLLSISSSVSALDGNASPVNLEAKNNIIVSSINTQAGINGAGGEVNAKSSGYFRVTSSIGKDFQNLQNTSIEPFTANASIATSGGVKGGAIRITSSSASIDTTIAPVDASSKNGNGGTIEFNAAGNITTGSIFSNSSGNGKGGDINLTSQNGTIDTSAGILNASSVPLLQLPRRNAGKITLDAKNGDILSGSIESTGLLGGSITLNSNSKISINNNDIASITTGSGVGGEINLIAREISLTNARVVSLANGEGKGGDIFVRASDNIHVQNNKRDYSQAVKGGSWLFNPFQQALSREVNFRGTGFFTTLLSGTGNSGNITIDTKKLTIINNAPSNPKSRAGIATFTFPGTNNNAGNITVKPLKLIEITGNGETVYNPSPGEDLLASINKARELQGIETGITSATQGSGNAGKIEIETEQLIIKNGAAITSGVTENATGQGNDIIINPNFNPNSSIELQGKADIATVSLALGSQSKAGNLNVNASIITLRNGAIIAADTFSLGRGGDLNINTNELNILGGSRISAATFTGGQGGNLTINSLQRKAQIVNIDGTLPDGQLPGNGQARSGMFTESRASGGAGNINIYTDTLDVKNRGEVSVKGSETGASGNLNVTAGSIFLTQQARLNATTSFGDGGNINIFVADSINMKNNGNQDFPTEITAQSLGTANGGNITMRVGKWIFAELQENSDIVAEAFGGNGGKIDATAAGSFGFIQHEKGRRLPESEFVASSVLGQNGIVDVNTQDFQPIPIPDVPVVREVPQVCPTAPGVNTRAAGRSAFSNAGRGGLPPNPGDVLESNITQVPWVTLDSQNTSSPSTNSSTLATAKKPEVISEAQGWQKRPNGRVKFTTQTSSFSFSSCIVGDNQR